MCGAGAGGGNAAGRAVGAGALVLACSCFALFPRRPVAASLIAVLALFCGAWYAVLWRRTLAPVVVPDAGGAAHGTVVGDPLLFGDRVQFLFRFAAPSRGTAMISAPRFPEPRYGDTLRIGPGNGSGTLGAGGRVWLRAARVGIERRGGGVPFIAALFRAKHRIVASFRAALPSDEAALMSGLLLGDRTGFSSELSAAMRASGTTHLVALSGYNIGIVVWAVAAALTGRFSRRTTIVLTVLAIALFVVAVGADASVVRAALMGCLALAAKAIGRTAQVWRGMVLSAFAMTLANPLVVRFDVGFQLSFLSLVGLVALEPVLSRILGADREGAPFFAVRSALAQTLAAQAAVLPLLLAVFGGVSGIAVAANVAVLPAVPVAMGVGALAAAGSVVAPVFGALFSWAAYPFLRYATGAISFFAGISAPFAIAGLPLWIFVLAYGALAALAVRHYRSSR